MRYSKVGRESALFSPVTPMTPSSPPPFAEQPLIAYFWSGNALRSRSVSDVVLSGVIGIPAPPTRLIADWERDALDLNLEPGDVEALTLARTRARWPDYKQCVKAMAAWTRELGLTDGRADILANSDVALMACRGARYHNDASQYGGAAFCNLFLSEDKDLDLHFPATGHRFPLQRGMAMVFDTGQPHAVVKRGASGFDAANFAQGQDCSQFFLTWELSLEDALVASAFKIGFDIDIATAHQLTEAQVRRGGERLAVNPDSGGWCPYA